MNVAFGSKFRSSPGSFSSYSHSLPFCASSYHSIYYYQWHFNAEYVKFISLKLIPLKSKCFLGLYLLTVIITPTLALLFHLTKVKTTACCQLDHCCEYSVVKYRISATLTHGGWVIFVINQPKGTDWEI